MNQQELLELIEQAAADGRTKLDLSRQKLTKLPPEIGQLTSLTSLDLNGNELTAVPPEIGRLTNLTSLDMHDNPFIKVIPPEIWQLTSLSLLDLRGNQLSAVSPEIGQMIYLTWLGLSANQLTFLPPEIGQLTSLILLDLRVNQLTDVPSEIGRLSNLTKLQLSRNQITAVPPEIGQLTSLTSLDLGHNRLTAVPPEIGELTNLSVLDLRSNQLTAMPSEIGQLISLTALHLGSNQLTALPPKIVHLFHFTELILSSNNLTAVPPEIGQLTGLTVLDLSRNQLKAVPPEIGQLTSLTSLELHSNHLRHLPNTLQQLVNLKWLFLSGNIGLGISQEVLRQANNPALILKTYFGARRPLHEAKMLLVGQGGVGKTALARRLQHDLPPDENHGKTEGVDIHKWQIEPSQIPVTNPITLNLWDFGGQGVYQATHQFFFTSRSLYLVVVNARTGEQESRLHHWMKLISGLSNNAPVIIVVNKQDEHALQLDERELKHKYLNLLKIVPTSCVTGAGIPELREAIADALKHLPHIYDQFPTDWLKLKADLEKMQANYITYERYAEYCREVGIEDRADQRSWVKVLHELGVVLNYQDENYRQLEGTHVLKPEWVTDGVYRILSDPDQHIANNAGILAPTMLDNILDPEQYPHHQQVFIVGMMQKFELSFRLPNGQNQHLIPDLLPKEQPQEAEFFGKTQLLRFEIHYTDFLPDSILSRFMVGMMAVLDRRSSWRNGAVLKFDDNEALVQADHDARKLFITVAGAEATRRSLLNTIRMQLHAIHSTFPNLPLTEHIPILGASGKTIAYHALCNLEKRGIEIHYDPVNDVELDVKALLAGIETPALRRERHLQERLMQAYDLDELQQICFDLAVEYENLPGQTKSAKTRELAQFMGRRGRMDELESKMRR
ncbi:MAG: leucine-rich repeat domain-containing protein [Anaerolineales bacterium]|nr:leucine-rich repeat domain-containing protein [Anaerolineales bacterium]